MKTINEQIKDLMKLSVDLDRKLDLPAFYERVKTVYYVNKTTGETFTEGEFSLAELHEKGINFADYDKKIKHISRADKFKVGIFGSTNHFVTNEEYEMYKRFFEVISDVASLKVPNILNPNHKDYNFRKELGTINAKIQYINKIEDEDKQEEKIKLLAEAEEARKEIFTKYNKEYKPIQARKPKEAK